VREHKTGPGRSESHVKGRELKDRKMTDDERQSPVLRFSGADRAWVSATVVSAVGICPLSDVTAEPSGAYPLG